IALHRAALNDFAGGRCQQRRRIDIDGDDAFTPAARGNMAEDSRPQAGRDTVEHINADHEIAAVGCVGEGGYGRIVSADIDTGGRKLCPKNGYQASLAATVV